MPPSLNVLRMMSAQLARLSQNCSSSTPRLPDTFFSILVSIDTVGYSCSNVKANLSRNASFNTLVPMNLPSSLPLPLVFAVAMILNPDFGFTNLPTFLRNTPLPSSMDWRHRTLLLAKSTSSSSKIAPLSSASTTGPLCQTVAPSTRRKPPIRSSSSVSMVMLTLINSLPRAAHACSTLKVLPLPDRPVMNVG